MLSATEVFQRFLSFHGDPRLLLRLHHLSYSKAHPSSLQFTPLRSFFFIIKPTRCINFTNLFCHETPHVSDSSSVHHQEFIHCTLSNGICHTGLQTAFEQDQDETVDFIIKKFVTMHGHTNIKFPLRSIFNVTFKPTSTPPSQTVLLPRHTCSPTQGHLFQHAKTVLEK